MKIPQSQHIMENEFFFKYFKSEFDVFFLNKYVIVYIVD